MSRVKAEVLEKGAEKLHDASIDARAKSHAKERLKALGSSRWLKVLGTAALLTGAAALSVGLSSISFGLGIGATAVKYLLAGGAAASGWGLFTAGLGVIKGNINKRERA